MNEPEIQLRTSRINNSFVVITIAVVCGVLLTIATIVLYVIKYKDEQENSRE